MSEPEMTKDSQSLTVVTEVVKWCLINENLTWLTGQDGNAIRVAGCGETDLLNVAGNLSTEVAKLGQKCSDVLQKIELSDLILLLGAGGVIAYLWKNSLQENSHSSSSSFMKWLLDEKAYRKENDKLTSSRMIYNLEQNSNILDNIPLDSSQEINNFGLNVLSAGNSPRKFLKHRLFDIDQLRDTTRFKNKVKSLNSDKESSIANQHKKPGSKYLPTARLYGNIERGTPDGQERCTPPSELSMLKHSPEKCHLNRASVDPKAFPFSGSMLEIMQNAKEVRRLIRDASFDSQASDFFLDIPVSFTNSETEETLQTFQDERDVSLPPENVHQFDSKGLWKLVGFDNLTDRESSVLSECSDHWRDIKPYKVALGHSSNVSEDGDDIESLIGSCLDPWEWDEECYYEGDFKSQTFETYSSEPQIQHTAWLPENGDELDLESELRLRNSSIYSSAYSSKESSTARDFHMKMRLPPSGRSSVESLKKSTGNSSEISGQVDE